MKRLTKALILTLCAVAAGAVPSAAAPIVIGSLSWEPDAGLGLGPTFTFENSSGGPLADLFLDLDTDLGRQSFGFRGVACADPDGDGVDECVSTPTIADGTPSQITDDLTPFVILAAYVRGGPERPLFLLDAEGIPLLDEEGDPLGLDGIARVSALVAYDSGPLPPLPPPPAPVPEPATLLLVGVGVSGVMLRARRDRRTE